MAHVALHSDQTRAVEVRNVYCIGRNYAAHIAELGNRPEEDPVVFIKPTSALLMPGHPIRLPKHSNAVHYEAELVLLIGQGGKNIPEESSLDHIAGYGLGLDLTARDLQTKAKQGGLPWAVAKGFDCAATVTSFVA
ncbi:MAG TPA: fumarylacetoacetate hydrolase family protein, partial [Limnobacter sp.]|nr:fumarylacetoacetate hydrolase family protein [Limnobacter sp.]